MLSNLQAARLVLASAIRDEITERVEEIRGEVRPELRPGERSAAYIGDVEVGAVAMTRPKASTQVIDWGELMAWAMEHVPDAIVTTTALNQAWVSALIRDGGEWTDPETGEVVAVPGVGVREGTPTLTVTKTNAARLWAAFSIPPTPTHLEIEGGDPE